MSKTNSQLRAGAPRKDPVVKKRLYGIKLPPYLVHFIDKQGLRQRPQLIEDAVLEKYGKTRDELIVEMKKDVSDDS